MINGFKDEYRFLSNFYNSSITWEGDIYPTAEHLYQALKADNRDDMELVRTQTTPARAKRTGSCIIGKPDWNSIRREVMMTVLIEKFTQNPLLLQKLVKTGSMHLAETNTWHDNYWGNCVCPKCEKKEGLNHLGKILMHVRRRCADLATTKS